MNNSIILVAATRLLTALLLLFSIFMLLRGHNLPGGGFIGGLLAAGGIAIYQLSCGVRRARRLLRVDPRAIAGVGVLTALGAGVVGIAARGSLLAGVWSSSVVPGVGKLGSPLLFDIGVFLVVIGAGLTILFTLDEEASG